MYRTMMEKLVQWKSNNIRKPLILQGVRQCGKTYLLKEFGSTYYDNVFYLNFDENKRLADFFEPDLNPQRIIKDMSLFWGRDIAPASTLIIFDEVQTCGNAITSLKYFCENAPEYHIIAAGSLLGVAIPKGTSFPVGKVEFLTMYPMNFYEFLYADNSMLAEALLSSPFDDNIWHSFRHTLKEQYRDFLIVGGMPEAVNSWINSKSIENVDKILAQVIQSYENDFAKHAPVSYFPKISAVWNSIPGQLSKENRKFIFSQVKKGWRAKDLEDALEWLARAGLVYKVEKIEKPYFPISAYANHTFFKLYLSDIGLLRKMANLPPRVLLDNTSNYKEFKGAMAENFVCSELKGIYQNNLHYWSADGSGRAEVDFIIQDEAYIIPIEVKAGSASRAKSLKEYRRLFNPEKSVLTALNSDNDNILPLYGFWNLKKWLNHL